MRGYFRDWPDCGELKGGEVPPKWGYLCKNFENEKIPPSKNARGYFFEIEKNFMRVIFVKTLRFEGVFWGLARLRGIKRGWDTPILGVFMQKL